MVTTQTFAERTNELENSQVSGQNTVILWAVVTAESERPMVRRGIYKQFGKTVYHPLTFMM